MREFEDLQKRKVDLAKKLLDKLVGASAKLAVAEELKQHELVEEWLTKYAVALGELLDLSKRQQALCPKENQCISLLQDEITGLNTAIQHVKNVVKGADLNQILISQVLILVSSRHTLVQLLKDSERLSA